MGADDKITANFLYGRTNCSKFSTLKLKSSAWEYKSLQIVKNEGQIASMEAQIEANRKLGKANHSK